MASSKKPVRHSGQHFLLDHQLIRQIILQADINRNHLVLDIGAGEGALTEPLSKVAGRVIAIEKDPGLVSCLKQMFANEPHVTILCKDAGTVKMPGKPFRVVSNIPYGLTTHLFGRLMDRPGSSSFAGGIIVIEWGAAKRFTEAYHRNPRLIGWNTWFELNLVRKVKPACFSPPPRVDSAMVEIRRRERPAVHPKQSDKYLAFVATLLRRPEVVSSSALKSLFTRKQVQRILADIGVIGSLPICQLDVTQWEHCFLLMDRLIPKQLHPRMPRKYRKWYR